MKHKTGNLRNSIVLKLSALVFAIALAVVILLFSFYSLFLNESTSDQAHRGLFIWLIVLVVVVFIVAIFILHHYLKPIKQLSEGVEEIRKGNLDNKIPVQSKDELGQLADAYNKMTGELKKMIQSRDQLLLDVSHELRTPLTNSRLALEMLPESKNKFSIMEDIGEMERMINELLETARLNSDGFTLSVVDIEVEAFLSKVLGNYSLQNNRVELSTVTKGIHISGDEARLTTVLKNLIDNALKYSAADADPVQVSAFKEASSVIIQVEDSGPGIPEEKLPFIFEPFYKADNTRAKQSGGYGLGLHLCKRIMEVHNAELKISNRTGTKGLTAQMVFPLNRKPI